MKKRGANFCFFDFIIFYLRNYKKALTIVLISFSIFTILLISNSKVLIKEEINYIYKDNIDLRSKNEDAISIQEYIYNNYNLNAQIKNNYLTNDSSITVYYSKESNIEIKDILIKNEKIEVVMAGEKKHDYEQIIIKEFFLLILSFSISILFFSILFSKSN